MPFWSFELVSLLVFSAFLLVGLVVSVIVRFRRQVIGANRLSMALAFCVLLLNGAVMFPALCEGSILAMLRLVWGFVLVNLYVGAGLALALREGFNPLPLLSRVLGEPSCAWPAESIEHEAATHRIGTSADTVGDSPTQGPEADQVRPTETRRAVHWGARKRVLLVVSACVAVNVYSLVLFRVTAAHPSKVVREALMTQEEQEDYERSRAAGEPWRPGITPRGMAVFAHLAVMEELIFRLFWLTFLLGSLRRFRWRGPVSIVLTSAVWALGHAGVVEPPWVKLVQISVIGLLLGYVYLRTGIEGAIATHLSLNLLGPWVITM